MADTQAGTNPNLVPLLYGTGASLTDTDIYVEGTHAGPITLQIQVMTADGHAITHTDKFLVCTQKTKAQWQQDIQDQMDAQSSYYPVTNIQGYSAANGFLNNRQNIKGVYSYYQQLFDQNPDFLWAGLAKLAGAPVYAGLSDAQYVVQGIASIDTISAFTSVATQGILSPVRNYLMGPGILNTAAKSIQTELIGGNVSIFSDLAWQFRAYQASGPWAIKYTSSITFDVPSISVNDWGQQYQGESGVGGSPVIQSAQYDLIDREQSAIIQPTWDFLGQNIAGKKFFSFFTKNPVSGGTSFWSFNPNGDISNSGDRLGWIFDSSNGVWYYWLSQGAGIKSSMVDQGLLQRAASYQLLPSALFPIQ